MCWYLKISCTLVTNLCSRVYNDLMDFIYLNCVKIDVDDQYQSSLNDYVAADYFDRHLAFSSRTKILLHDALLNPIEKVGYFRAVDRVTAEDILAKRIDGSCLVRPYKVEDKCIKFIATIYAKNNYFHLYIRKVNDKYALGLEKPKEKYFNNPIDIINYYRLNKLQCTNSCITTKFFLIPIT